MKKKFLLLAPLGALIAAASPAAAQNATDMVGPRVELRAGWDHHDVDAAFVSGATTAIGDDSQSGVSFGAEIGYDALVAGSFTLGAYAGLDFSTAEECGSVFGADQACIDAGRNITLGVRAGVPIGERALVYVKGGYSNGRLNTSYTRTGLAIDADEDLDGFHIGAGAELALGSRAYGKIEYVYTGYEDFAAAVPGFAYAVDTNRHQVLLGVGLRF